MIEINCSGEKAVEESLERFKNVITQQFNKVVKAVAFSMHTDLKSTLTPKKSGWARSHWSIATKIGNQIEPIIQTLDDFGPGGYIYLYNNVPYIKRLDNGWSIQRPKGFSHLAIRNGERLLKQKFITVAKELYD